METKEGNILIADFMGWKHHADPDYDNYEMSKLVYHRSWDALMPVVEKIESLTSIDGRGEVNYVVTIEPGICTISQGGESPNVEIQESETKITNVWLAIIGFIKWYK